MQVQINTEVERFAKTIIEFFKLGEYPKIESEFIQNQTSNYTSESPTTTCAKREVKKQTTAHGDRTAKQC